MHYTSNSSTASDLNMNEYNLNDLFKNKNVAVLTLLINYNRDLVDIAFNAYWYGNIEIKNYLIKHNKLNFKQIFSDAVYILLNYTTHNPATLEHAQKVIDKILQNNPDVINIIEEDLQCTFLR